MSANLWPPAAKSSMTTPRVAAIAPKTRARAATLDSTSTPAPASCSRPWARARTSCRPITCRIRAACSRVAEALSRSLPTKFSASISKIGAMFWTPRARSPAWARARSIERACCARSPFNSSTRAVTSSGNSPSKRVAAPLRTLASDLPRRAKEARPMLTCRAEAAASPMASTAKVMAISSLKRAAPNRFRPSGRARAYPDRIARLVAEADQPLHHPHFPMPGTGTPCWCSSPGAGLSLARCRSRSQSERDLSTSFPTASICQ